MQKKHFIPLTAHDPCEVFQLVIEITLLPQAQQIMNIHLTLFMQTFGA